MKYKILLKWKLVWGGYGMSIFYDSNTESYTIIFGEDEIIESGLNAHEAKLYYNSVVNMINSNILPS